MRLRPLLTRPSITDSQSMRGLAHVNVCVSICVCVFCISDSAHRTAKVQDSAHRTAKAQDSAHRTAKVQDTTHRTAKAQDSAHRNAKVQASLIRLGCVACAERNVLHTLLKSNTRRAHLICT